MDVFEQRTAGIIQHYEKRLDTTYFIYIIDTRLACVVLVDGTLRKGGQSSTVRFLQFVGDGLCCKKVRARIPIGPTL